MLRTCTWPKFSIHANGELVAQFQEDEWQEYYAWKAFAIRKFGRPNCQFSD